MEPHHYLMLWLYVAGMGLAHMACVHDVEIATGGPGYAAGQRTMRALIVIGWPVFFPIVLALGSLGIIKTRS